MPPDIRPNRTKMMADIIRFHKPKSIVETGTWNGGRAIEMALAAFENADSIDYTGYDLFEDCLLYTSPSPRDRQKSRMPSSA